jgi:hypothetical protein
MFVARQLHYEDISLATYIWRHCVATTCEIVRSCWRQSCLGTLLHSYKKHAVASEGSPQ